MISFILEQGFVTFLSASLSIWSIVCMWIIFKKAGRKGWESLIPVWNVYVLFKIAGKKGWFWILLLLPILWIALTVVSWSTLQSGDVNEYSTIYTIKSMGNWLLGLLSLIIPVMARITLPYGLTKKFNQSNWFYIGMLLLTPIFFGILAFSDAKYEGIEFDKKYSLKKGILITLLISLLIGGCNAGIKYYQYKDFYNYFNNLHYDYETNNESEVTEEKEEKSEPLTDKDGNILVPLYEVHSIYDDEYWDRISDEFANYHNECNYRDGHCITYDKYFYEINEGDYKNGKQEGEWIKKNEVGVIEETQEYSNGEKNGKFLKYNIYGKISKEGNYKNGKEEGERKSYYNNGDLFSIGNYKNGEQVGEWNYYRKDGTRTKLIFKEGKAWEGTEIMYWGTEYNYKNGTKLN